jgi:hypothetical protein
MLKAYDMKSDELVELPAKRESVNGHKVYLVTAAVRATTEHNIDGLVTYRDDYGSEREAWASVFKLYVREVEDEAAGTAGGVAAATGAGEGDLAGA